MVIFGFILGAILGSFTKALADRSLSKKTFLGRSKCPSCKKELNWYDLIPLLSYILLKGRCRYCTKKIGPEYPVTEVITGILIGYLFFQAFANFSAIGGPAFGWQLLIFISDLSVKTFFITILVGLTITDLKKMLIPDRIILPSIVIAFFATLIISIIKIIYLYYYLSIHPIGKYLLPPHSNYFFQHAFLTAQPFLGGLLSGLVIGGFFYLLIIITRGKGMGGGDVKLGAFMGLILGFPHSFIALVLSFLTGAILAIFLLLSGKKKMGQAIPFGPFLVLGSLIALFWGEKILNWYLKLSF